MSSFSIQLDIPWLIKRVIGVDSISFKRVAIFNSSERRIEIKTENTTLVDTIRAVGKCTFSATNLKTTSKQDCGTFKINGSRWLGVKGILEQRILTGYADLMSESEVRLLHYLDTHHSSSMVQPKTRNT